MNDLDKIISVRQRRFQKTKDFENFKKRELVNAEDKLRNARNALTQFSNELKELEKNLLLEVIEKEISVWVIENINLELSKARERANKLAREHDDLQKKVLKKTDECQAAVLKSLLASKKLEKLTEANTILLDQEKAEKRQLSEAKNEEISEMIFAAKFTRG